MNTTKSTINNKAKLKSSTTKNNNLTKSTNNNNGEREGEAKRSATDALLLILSTELGINLKKEKVFFLLHFLLKFVLIFYLGKEDLEK